MKTLKVTLSILLGFTYILTPISGQTPDKVPTKSIDLMWGVKIPMRDGIKLNATIYKPKNAQSLPVIFILTPYISDSQHTSGYYFSQNDYVFAIVDSRGRGNSEGSFTPDINESNDGCDVVEWISEQPWCDGRVAMYGGSYAGNDQWYTAKGFPPNLKTIVPVASSMPSVSFPFLENIFFTYSIQWLYLVSGVTNNSKLYSESSFWINKYRELYLNHLPFRDLDKILGNSSPIFQTYLSFPNRGDFWDAYNPTNEEFAKINLPILTITGQYDGDQPGAMEYYKMHMKFASEEAKEKHYLIIGPWDHAGTRTPKIELGGLTFGSASIIDMNKLHKDWYNWVLKSEKKPDFLKNRVAYYVTGKEIWKYAKSLDSISKENLILFLDSNLEYANDAYHSGYLTEIKPARSNSDRFVYNPLDTRPAELDTAEVINYLTDQRYALNLYGNGLIYHSEPFKQNTEISGYIKLSLWISMDVPDTDFEVDLYEITPDGKSIFLTSDFLRARHRESLRKEVLIEPRTILNYSFARFNWFSREISKGSRLRLMVKCVNSIYLQKNYNSGKNVIDESGKDARTANITVYHNSKYPGILELPVVR